MAPKQNRGFRIRLKLVKLIKCVFHERQTHKLKSTSCTDKTMARLCKFGRSLKRSVKELCGFKSSLKYGRIGRERFDEKVCVPRGHLAVYIGEEEDDVCRVLVPVIYFNHPFFGELLKEAEKVYGHDHCGGIHVPCRLSEFEDVENRICAAAGSWRRWLL